MATITFKLENREICFLVKKDWKKCPSPTSFSKLPNPHPSSLGTLFQTSSLPDYLSLSSPWLTSAHPQPGWIRIASCPSQHHSFSLQFLRVWNFLFAFWWFNPCPLPPWLAWRSSQRMNIFEELQATAQYKSLFFSIVTFKWCPAPKQNVNDTAPASFPTNIRKKWPPPQKKKEKKERNDFQNRVFSYWSKTVAASTW